MSSHAHDGASTELSAEHVKVERVPRSLIYRKRLSARHTLKIIIRNGLYAAVARILIGILKLVAKRGLGKAFWNRLPREILSLNPLKWAVVFGGFSSFRLCMQTVTRCGRIVGLPEKGAALISGCLCSLPALVMNKETRTELCLYALVRALHTFCLRFVCPLLPEILQKFEHYDVILMCAGASQISYGCLFAQNTLPRSYQAFLVKASTYDKLFIRAHSGYIRGHITPDFLELMWNHNLPVVSHKGPEVEVLLCEFAHRGHSCNTWALQFLVRNMLKMGIPLYGPLKLVTTALLHRKDLLKRPVRTLSRILRSTLTSSLFLALYVTTIVRSSCFALRHGAHSGVSTSIMCFFAGFATLLEPKGRRMDLALYCAMYAIRSFVLTQYRLGRIPYPRHWFVFSTYVASMSFLFFEYEEEPQLLNPRVRSALRMLLGEKFPKRQSRAASRTGSRAPSRVPTPSMKPAMDPLEKMPPHMELNGKAAVL